jgi:hypothetical protein
LLQNKKIRVRAALSLAVAIGAAGGYAQTGGQAGDYLRAPTGATMTAMGGGQSASPPYLATWWNPAQLASLDRTIFSFGTGLYSLGRTEAFSALEFKLPPRVGIGLLCLYRGDPFIDKLYTSDEVPLPSGAFTSITTKVALSYLISRRLSAGLSLGVFYERLPTSYNETTTGTGIDASLNYSDATSVSGFSLGVQYRATDSLTLAFVIRDVDPLLMLSGTPASITMNWQLSESNGDYNPSATDFIMPAFVLGAMLHHHLLGHPLLWSCDIDAYVVDGTWTKLNYMEARLHTGIEWQRWNTFRIRCGIDDLPFNRSMFEAPQNGIDYWHDFSCRITGGFGWDLVKVRRGLTLNYSVATDKVWAGIDEMLDVVCKF